MTSRKVPKHRRRRSVSMDVAAQAASAVPANPARMAGARAAFST